MHSDFHCKAPPDFSNIPQMFALYVNALSGKTKTTDLGLGDVCKLRHFYVFLNKDIKSTAESLT